MLQIGRNPQLEAVRDEPGADSENDDRDARTREGPAEQLTPAAACPLLLSCLVLFAGDDRGAEVIHDLLGLVPASGCDQEAGRLGDPVVQRYEQDAGRQPDQPEDPPAVVRGQRAGQPAR